MLNCLIVGTGGFLGSVLRYLIGQLPVHPTVLPCLTLFINICGSFLIGFLAGLVDRSVIGRHPWQPFFIVGFCGGFTTFSTFAFEADSMLATGRFGQAATYIAASVGFCLAAVWLGRRCAS